METADALTRWRELPRLLAATIKDLPEEALALRKGTAADSLSIRELVHHIVESNLIASNIILAALAKSGVTFDWSWVTPGAAWMQRMRYDSAPIAPALTAFEGVCDYVATLVAALPDGFNRHVQLLDAPGAALYSKTVHDLLIQEIDHADGHLGDIRDTLEADARTR